MAKQKNGQAKPETKTEKRHVIYASVPRELIEALERYLSSTRPRPDKGATVEVAIEDFLKSKGFWPPKQEP